MLGVNLSPFQTQFVLQQHAKKYKDSFPMATETIEKSTYMDDSMDSVHTEEQGMELYHQLSNLLSKAGMHARKYKDSFPMATETIEKSTYMGDSMDSVHTEEQGMELYHQLSNVLSKAGMHARKWLSNSSSVLAEIKLED